MTVRILAKGIVIEEVVVDERQRSAIRTKRGILSQLAALHLGLLVELAGPLAPLCHALSGRVDEQSGVKLRPI